MRVDLSQMVGVAVGAAVDSVSEATLRDRLLAAGIQPLDPEYVRLEKRKVLRQVWPKAVGGAWQIPWVLAALVNVSILALIVTPAVLFPIVLGSGFWECVDLAVEGLIVGFILLVPLSCPVKALEKWLSGLCQRASTRWVRVPERLYRPHESRLPPEPEVIKMSAFRAVPGVRFEVEYPRSTRDVPDPFLIAILDHEDGVSEESYIAQWL